MPYLAESMQREKRKTMTLHHSNWGPLSAPKLLRLRDLDLVVYGMLCWIWMLGWIGLTSLAPHLAWSCAIVPAFRALYQVAVDTNHITSHHVFLTQQIIEYGAVCCRVGIENLRIRKGRGPSFFSGCWCTEQDDLERRKRAVGNQDIDFRYFSFPVFVLLGKTN